MSTAEWGQIEWMRARDSSHINVIIWIKNITIRNIPSVKNKIILDFQKSNNLIKLI